MITSSTKTTPENRVFTSVTNLPSDLPAPAKLTSTAFPQINELAIHRHGYSNLQVRDGVNDRYPDGFQFFEAHKPGGAHSAGTDFFAAVAAANALSKAPGSSGALAVVQAADGVFKIVQPAALQLQSKTLVPLTLDEGDQVRPSSRAIKAIVQDDTWVDLSH